MTVTHNLGLDGFSSLNAASEARSRSFISTGASSCGFAESLDLVRLCEPARVLLPLDDDDVVISRRLLTAW